jgi:DNA-binding MarR family transcriptional regulator
MNDYTQNDIDGACVVSAGGEGIDVINPAAEQPAMAGMPASRRQVAVLTPRARPTGSGRQRIQSQRLGSQAAKMKLMVPAALIRMTDDCNCFAVRSAARHVSQFYDQVLAPIGVRTTQFSILAKLKLRGPLTINVLAKDMVMDRTTLGRNILPLERDELIRIEPFASDHRMKELHLTNTGEKRLQVALKAWSQAQAHFETNFGAKLAAELRALLRSVVASEFTSTAR